MIVVDRLLTGFDAPCLSTLFIDRQPMQPHDLIQAFSRTNRLFDKNKKYGQIVTFQKPKVFEEEVKNALILYSNGGETEVLAPTWEEATDNFITAIEEMREIVSSPAEVENLNEAELKKFIKAYQKLDRAYSSVQVYTDFTEDKMGTVFPINEDEIEEFHGRYKNVLEEIKEDDPETDEVEPIDIFYELESVKTEEINYEYILNLIQAFVPSGDDEYELISKVDQKAMNEVDQYIDQLAKSNEKLARLMRHLWNNIQQEPENYRDQNVSNLLEDMVQGTSYEVQQEFSDKWQVDEEELAYVMENYNPKKKHQNGEQELQRTADYSTYKEKAEEPVSKLKYGKTMRKELDKVMKEEILPLRRQ
ncbi:type I restriction-modification system, restriction subunit R [Tetragenococcus muriaticus PMC-11-5]|uniref:Type I restriction-modification system, restriction subunit R n=1 Tax=Tetragenococcus muriaticus PMC-11-5 TaxID=1302649 RepID=A0A091C3C4_9ENTE|nr:type I restriction-modification system, restriction subunit R [Tetragenococcus muriaticus PMC-11-5]